MAAIGKLLEDALIKITTVVSTITTLSVRDMIEALIRGERDPQRLADLARGVMRRHGVGRVCRVVGAELAAGVPHCYGAPVSRMSVLSRTEVGGQPAGHVVHY